MKRGAEKQLTKDGGSDDDDEIEETRGFQKADDSILAGRKIAGLPKRGMKKATSIPGEDSATKPAGSTFGGFQGFGTNASSQFTFNPPPSTTLAATTSTSGTSAASSTASSTAKAFSSIIGGAAVNGNSNPIQKTTPLTSQPTIPNVSSSTSTEDDGAVEYYRSLRGLNVSFVSTITKAVEGDQFVDITGLLEQYKSLRIDIQRNYDQKKSKSSSSTTTSSTATIPASSSFSTNPPTAMPTPPASFTGFSTKPLTSASSGSGGGFTPTIGSTSSSSSPFSFPTTAPPISKTSPAALPFAVTSSDTSSSTTTAAPTNFFKSSTATTTANLFGTPSSSTSTPSIFGAPTAGSFSFGAPSADKDKSASSSTPSTPPPASKNAFSGFGGATKTSPGGGSIGNPVGFGFGAGTGSSSSSASPFGFGASKTTGSSFAFGAPAASATAFGAKPTGDSPFSFAKAPATPPASQETEGETSHSTTGTGTGSQGGAESQVSQGGEDGVATGMFGPNPHDEDGEGEEDEDTVHLVKSKVFKMKKENGTTTWADLGTGLLKLKKHKTGDQRRMLLRNSSNGKININFNLYPGLVPTQSQKTVSFVGHEGGNAQAYRIRVKTEEQARELKEVLDREIAFVKSKSTE